MKLSQNRSDADRTSVAGVLQASEDANAHEVGEMMRPPTRTDLSV